MRIYSKVFVPMRLCIGTGSVQVQFLVVDGAVVASQYSYVWTKTCEPVLPLDKTFYLRTYLQT